MLAEPTLNVALRIEVLMNETITKLSHIRPQRLCVCRSFFMLFLVSLFSLNTHAVEFRVESKVYADDGQQPLEHRIALFDEKATYDIGAVDVGRSSILLRDQEVLILIDTVKKKYTRISRIDLARHFVLQQDRIRKMAPDRQAALNPSLKEEGDRQSKTLTLTNPHLTYSARLVTKSPEIVRRYREFTDWHARLNAIMPGSPSPSPRLALNKAIATRDAVPTEVTKTHIVDTKIRSRLRSEHRYEKKWRDDDRRRVKQIMDSYRGYQEVELADFLRVATAAKARQR
jgi:hypothetical protein